LIPSLLIFHPVFVLQSGAQTQGLAMLSAWSTTELYPQPCFCFCFVFLFVSIAFFSLFLMILEEAVEFSLTRQALYYFSYFASDE
jgi:hypothetical protein